MFVDVFGARKTEEAFEDVWGHLKPEPGTYPGYYEVTISSYGDETLHTIQFKDVDDNPWTFAACDLHIGSFNFDEPGVYRFEGTINEKHELKGKWKKVY